MKKKEKKIKLEDITRLLDSYGNVVYIRLFSDVSGAVLTMDDDEIAEFHSEEEFRKLIKINLEK